MMQQGLPQVCLTLFSRMYQSCGDNSKKSGIVGV